MTGPARAPETPLLELQGVCAAYGSFPALFDVSFTVAPSSATALVGSNGSGKSTCARAITGLVNVTAGSIRFEGREITHRPTWRTARSGIAHVNEGSSVFSTLSVEENLQLACLGSVGRRGVKAALDVAFEAFPQLATRRSQVAGTMSGGEQRMLALARTFAVPHRLTIVDELSFGLAPAVVEHVYQALEVIRDAGRSLLVIEQNVERALAVADHVVVLRKGAVVGSGAPHELRDDLDALVLGRDPAAG